MRTILIFLLAAHVASAADTVDYVKDIKPILARHCFACHGTLRQKSELRLDTIGFIKKGGSRGSLIVARKPTESPLLHAVLGRNDYSKMPPEDSGTELTKEEIDQIARWIADGAKAADEPVPSDPREHWSYRRPRKSKRLTAGNPIDRHFARVHQKRGLSPQPAAPREMWLRRVYLDLIGLPPTIEEIDAFLKDDSENAHSTVVMRLLENQHHGERWGRHFMDIWRYTDWFGLGKEVRFSQKHIWRWRDWIIESLNADKGYDRMIVEMLAADEVAGDDLNALRATGFLARNWHLFNRSFWLDDTVHHTAKGLLGITINCARCHDHKYDPISQQEYYQFRAFFEPHKVRLDPIPGQPDLDKDGLPRVFDEDLKAPTYLFIRGSEETPDKSRTIPAQTFAVISTLPEIKPVQLPVAAYYPALRQEHIQQSLLALEKKQEAAGQLLKASVERKKQLEARLKQLQQDPKGVASQSTALIHDEFKVYDEKLWRQTGGTFEYMNGFVVHTNQNGGQHRLEAKQSVPMDFVASLRLKVLSGNTRSLGMAFDMVGGDRIGVYLSPSAHFVSMYQIIKGVQSYPARKNLPIVNNKFYDLTIAVRGPLLNVWLNGKFAFAHRLTAPRRDGGFAITNYQSATEYHEFSLSPLEQDVVLAEKTADGSSLEVPAHEVSVASIEQSLNQLERKMQIDHLALAASKLECDSFEIRAKAERIKYGLNQGDINQSAFEAALAEKQWNQAKAKLAVNKAEAVLARVKTKNSDEKTIAYVEEILRTEKEALAAATNELSASDSQYMPIGKVYPSTSSGRRTALARWIANTDNPLTARVLVNHVWTRHFGDSLVDSMFDFGLRTKPPRHQELLDHLAVEFVEHNWSLHFLHRVICESKLYQMHSSGIVDSAENRLLDPDNRDYWRMNTRRMEHEILRDSLLHVAGRLDSKLGGPDLPTKDAESAKGTRRTIYYRHARDDKIRMSRQFDDASVEECYRRKQTIVPQQALVLANSEFVQIQVNAIADRLRTDDQKDDFIQRAFQSVLGREPSTDELTVASKATAQLATSIRQNGATDNDATQAANRHLIHVLVMHNDFIMIR